MHSKFLIILCAAFAGSRALALDLQRTNVFCGATAVIPLVPPTGAAGRLADSQVAGGSARHFLGVAGVAYPLYPHKSFGSTVHAGAVHMQACMPKSFHLLRTEGILTSVLLPSLE